MSPQTNYPQTATSLTGSNSAWTNPQYIETSSNTNFATTLWATGGASSNGLQGSNFGFNLPSTAIIDGILVTFNRYSDAGGTTSVQITNGTKTGTITGSDIWPSTPAPVSYGGPTNLWGQTWTYSDINNTNFAAIINAYNTHGGADGYVNAMQVSVYWHTAPANVAKRYIYQTFDNLGNYLGLLPNVSNTNDTALWSQNINTAGAQMTIDCMISVDTSYLNVNNLTDESGNLLTDESGNLLTPEGALDLLFSQNSVFKEGNRIKCYETSYYYPNGKLIFQGQIQKWTAEFGGDNDDELIELLVYSDGVDMQNLMLIGGATLDQSQTVNNSSYLLDRAFAIGQEWTPTQNTLSQIQVQIDTAGVNATIDLDVYVSPSNLTRLAHVSQVVNTNSMTTVTFYINPVLSITSGQPYFFSISTEDNEANVGYDSTTSYAGGAMYEYTGTYWSSPAGSMWFETYYGGSSTQVTYTSTDPSTMTNSVMTLYNDQGGSITAPSSNIATTGLSVTYTFNAKTVLSGIQEILTICPSNWWWYVDVGLDQLFLQPASSTAQYTLIKGKHITSLKIIKSIEAIANVLYFSGGVTSNGPPPVNLYSVYQDASSIAEYGHHLAQQSNNAVTIQATADVIGNGFIGTNKLPQYQTQVTVLDTTMDISQFTPGQTIGFSGFGTNIDNLVAQIVTIERHMDYVTLTLGTLPKQMMPDFEKIRTGLVALQTVNNPATPTT